LIVFIFIENIVTLTQKFLLESNQEPFDHTTTEVIENMDLIENFLVFFENEFLEETVRKELEYVVFDIVLTNGAILLVSEVKILSDTLFELNRQILSFHKLLHGFALILEDFIRVIKVQYN